MSQQWLAPPYVLQTWQSWHRACVALGAVGEMSRRRGARRSSWPLVIAWLIRRFVDPNAVFLFVLPAEVTAVAERFNATPFDIDGVFWSHRGPACTFDTMKPG